MNTLPLSQFIFPDPIEADPEGHGLICIGADLSLLPYMKHTPMVSFLGLMKMSLFVGGAQNLVV